MNFTLIYNTLYFLKETSKFYYSPWMYSYEKILNRYVTKENFEKITPYINTHYSNVSTYQSTPSSIEMDLFMSKATATTVPLDCKIQS